jgi:hypothetical protein
MTAECQRRKADAAAREKRALMCDQSSRVVVFKEIWMTIGKALLLMTALVASSPAFAAVMDFSTLPEAEGQPVTSYSENGFTLTAIDEVFAAKTAFASSPFEIGGNPLPAIFVPFLAGDFRLIKSGGGEFSLVSFDFASPEESFFIPGMLGRATVYTSFGGASFNTFQTYSLPSDLIDSATFGFAAQATWG